MNLSRRSTFIGLLLLATALPGKAKGPEGLPGFGEFKLQLQQTPAPQASGQAAPTSSQGSLSAAPALPSEFEIYENVTPSFGLWKGKTRLGTIKRNLLRLTKTFTYLGKDKSTLAKARARIITLGATIDVTDEAGLKIGTIKEDLLKSLLKVYTHYTIYDAAGKEIATSEKLDLFSTEVTLRAPDGRVVAEVRRGFKRNLMRVYDLWDVKIKDASIVDPRMLVFIPAYKTTVDNSRRRAAVLDAILKALEKESDKK